VVRLLIEFCQHLRWLSDVESWHTLALASGVIDTSPLGRLETAAALSGGEDAEGGATEPIKAIRAAVSSQKPLKGLYRTPLACGMPV
jgi:predicted amidohydrolase YtcJ